MPGSVSCAVTAAQPGRPPFSPVPAESAAAPPAPPATAAQRGGQPPAPRPHRRSGRPGGAVPHRRCWPRLQRCRGFLTYGHGNQLHSLAGLNRRHSPSFKKLVCGHTSVFNKADRKAGPVSRSVQRVPVLRRPHRLSCLRLCGLPRRTGVLRYHGILQHGEVTVPLEGWAPGQASVCMQRTRVPVSAWAFSGPSSFLPRPSRLPTRPSADAGGPATEGRPARGWSLNGICRLENNTRSCFYYLS